MAERTLSTRYGFAVKEYYYATIPREEWITVMVVAAISMTIGIFLLAKETRRRTSGWFSFSYLMVLYPPLIAIVHLLAFPDGICLITRNIGELFIWLQMFDFLCVLLMKLKESIPPQNAYPNWIYPVLYTLSTMWVIAEILTWNVFLATTSCGIENGDAFFNLKTAEFLGDNYMVGVSGLFINLFGGCLLTLVIIVLYECKLKSIEDVKARSEMNRVLVMTYFIMLSVCWINFIRIMLDGSGPVFGIHIAASYGIADCIQGVAYGFGTMLIQKHNDSEYTSFLKVVDNTKLYLCCCCCYRKPRDQYQVMIKSGNVDLDAKPEVQLSDVVNV